MRKGAGVEEPRRSGWETLKKLFNIKTTEEYEGELISLTESKVESSFYETHELRISSEHVEHSIIALNAVRLRFEIAGYYQVQTTINHGAVHNFLHYAPTDESLMEVVGFTKGDQLEIQTHWIKPQTLRVEPEMINDFSEVDLEFLKELKDL